MLNLQIKEHLVYFRDEKNQRLKEKFFSSVIFFSFQDCLKIVFAKYKISLNENDLSQDIQILLFERIDKILKADDCNAFIIRMVENYVKNYLKCRAKSFIVLQDGEN